jgi:hypothetical protein
VPGGAASAANASDAGPKSISPAVTVRTTPTSTHAPAFAVSARYAATLDAAPMAPPTARFLALLERQARSLR